MHSSIYDPADDSFFVEKYTCCDAVRDSTVLGEREGKQCVSFRTMNGKGTKPVYIELFSFPAFVAELESGNEYPVAQRNFYDACGATYSEDFYEIRSEYFLGGKGAQGRILVPVNEFQEFSNLIRSIYERL